ncbi:U-box domain-containing protein 33-like isoform X2 [Prosopis cineraria]|uniref:U-box domain-containing protein 33-like isoform X2 n=1 Tax=Prosopis cineraria TaxID=364024 RepID=UPI00240EEBA1|nr:U-box domain-containing protein 33-like isoform X2 [Prosopis cineraria]
MEVLNPSHPPQHQQYVAARDPFHGYSPPLTLTLPFAFQEAATSQLTYPMAECTESVYVAVGKSVDKTVHLLRWTFGRFSNSPICILHVHQPSSMIPTLLGKLPATQANPEVVSAFRREERDQTTRLLENYLSICRVAKVEATSVIGEAEQAQKGIIDLIIKHGVRKLVIGAVPDNRMKVRRNSKKANYAAKNAPPFCEIWFVHKGSLLSRSFQYGKSELLNRSNSARTTICTGIDSWSQGEILETDPTSSSKSSTCVSHCSPQNSTGGYLETSLDVEEDILCSQLTEAKIEVEAARDKGFAELLKCKRFEAEAIEAIKKVNMFESARAYEVKLRKEAENELRATLQEQQRLLDESEEVASVLQRTMRNIALLDSRVQEANCRHDEAADELLLIQASISTLWHEKQQIRRQKMEAHRWLDRWKSRGQFGVAHCHGFIGFADELPELAEFSLSDLQNATCNFSESFKIAQGGYGCIYKGEMLGRTVAIRKFHPHNIQGPAEFHQEVQVLGSLQHPHLLTLLGVCPEAWSLVYEYLPNGSLQDLFRKNNNPSSTWNSRARMIAEIASALCFLHTSKPKTIVHGNLKPETILLDSALRCKICGFGFCRLLTEESLYRPSFRFSTEPKGTSAYTDPELERTGILTPKSDIYSFGLIILQLLTGRTIPVGLAGEVRKAVSCGKLSSILDSSAGEWPPAVATQLVELGLQCCQQNGRDRPELTPTLVRELEQLHVSEDRPVPSFFLCPILQEIMHDPQVAADGFTYEGEAIREWLENGHETSPMTNLKLSHLHLTPNHALRLAIQDWLCKS